MDWPFGTAQRRLCAGFAVACALVLVPLALVVTGLLLSLFSATIGSSPLLWWSVPAAVVAAAHLTWIVAVSREHEERRVALVIAQRMHRGSPPHPRRPGVCPLRDALISVLIGAMSFAIGFVCFFALAALWVPFLAVPNGLLGGFAATALMFHMDVLGAESMRWRIAARWMRGEFDAASPADALSRGPAL